MKRNEIGRARSCTSRKFKETDTSKYLSANDLYCTNKLISLYCMKLVNGVVMKVNYEVIILAKTANISMIFTT